MENTTKLTRLSTDFDLDVKKENNKTRKSQILTKTLTYVFLTIGAFFSFLPFYWMVISSLKTEGEYRASVPTFFPMEKIQWKNYVVVVTAHEGLFTTTLINTIIVGLISTILGLIIIIISAYAFARLNFKGKEFLFSLMLATMMIPGELFTTTNYITVGPAGFFGKMFKGIYNATGFYISDSGIKNTYVIMILPFLVSFYYIFLLRNAFKQIPDSLYQAAKVDGCSDLGYLIKVMVPLTAPTLISITLLKFIGTWNSYIWPQLVNSEKWQLISNWVMHGFSDKDGILGYTQYAPELTLDSLKMAAACMVTLPLFILFICFRKYIMTGVSKSGTKG